MKRFVLSIALLGCSAAQGMEGKTDIQRYVAKASALAKKKQRPVATRGGSGNTESRESQWLVQLEKIEKMLSEKTLYLGVPKGQQARSPEYKWRFLNYWFGNYTKIPKQYFLLKPFESIDNAYDISHYELYFMPDDLHLGDVCEALIENINWYFEKEFDDDENQTHAQEFIKFIAVRPTPGITYSPYDGKPMPRIVIGFKPMTDQDDTIENRKLELLIYFLSKTIPNTGCLGTLGYSNRVMDSCVFWKYGSPDNGEQASNSWWIVGQPKQAEQSAQLFKRKEDQPWKPWSKIDNYIAEWKSQHGAK